VPVIIIAAAIISYSQQADAEFQNTIRMTAAMVSNQSALRLASEQGFGIMNVTWEDTGRYKGSSVGPNISDMTIQVQRQTGTGFELTCMPVIRYPNFSDKSADISPDKFFLTVGNEKGKSPKRVTLREYLKNPDKYMNDSGSWKGGPESLLAKRDTHVLVSAQACFLPVPKQGIAEFNPVLFNYQSRKGHPAVLAILATRQGTSMTVIDNSRDAFNDGGSWGQRLFFNKNGERAVLTGQRASDFKRAESSGTSELKTEAAGQTGLNLVMLIQVPLKYKEPSRPKYSGSINYSMMRESASGMSDVEEAVISHGRVEGPFTEIDGLKIERDPRFPIRVTVQFYKATSNGVLNKNDMESIRQQIGRVYEDADYVGSLVTEGATGRPTEYEGPKFQPPDWWDNFWKKHKSETGLTPEETIRYYRKVTGGKWNPASENEFRDDVKKLEEKRNKK
jgi:hypothetical protein